MTVFATIDDSTVYVGGQGRLGPPTTLLTITLPHLASRWSEAEKALQSEPPQWLGVDVMFDMGPRGWPGALLSHLGPEPLGFAHWVTALCVALQRWAGDPVWQGQVLWQAGDRARLALPWIRTEVLDGAIQLAVRHVLIHFEPEHERAQKAHVLAHDRHAWRESVKFGGQTPNGSGLALAAARRGIPVQVRPGFVQLGWGAQALRLDSSFTGNTSNIASKVARDKAMTKQILWDAGIPVPQGKLVTQVEQALSFAQTHGWPVVIKPHNLDGGVAVTPGIGDEVELRAAYARAASASGGAVMVERHVQGHDHRLLVVHGRLMATTRRMAGGVVGDGRHTVVQLIERTNQDPLRGREQHSPLVAIDLDNEALICLAQQALGPDSVLAAGRYVYLRRTANISTGGTAEDMTGRVHPDNRLLAERAARLMGLDVAGIDMICPDIARSWQEVGGVICEVNAQPGLRVHRRGDPDRDLFGEIIDTLTGGRSLRIPTAAITGTNGKTTVARMLHHIWRQTGQTAGVTTTQGVWVGDAQVTQQNLSGHPGAMVLLNDPAVAAAVLELPRKGLIRFGQPCDHYDVAALLNVQDDHIGVDGINDLAQMARLKAQVLERATQAVVVNAQDPLTLAMLTHCQAPRQILVSGHEQAPALKAHLAKGAEAVIAQSHEGQTWIVHAQGETLTPIMPLHQVPAMMNGLLAFNRDNALFAVALAWAQGLPLACIRQGMATFCNDTVHNIGRFNFLPDLPFTAVLDFGHNPDGIRQLCAVIKRLPATGQRRLACLSLGNRHRSHLAQVARDLAMTFDHIVLGCDPVLVTQTLDYQGPDPVQTMLTAGRDHLHAAGMLPPQVVLEAIPGVALRTAMRLAQPGDVLVMLAEPDIALSVADEFKIR